MEKSGRIMEVFLITGTSRGIGKALAIRALEKGAKVYGYSRNCTIEHSNYTHTSVDFSDLKQVEKIDFPDGVFTSVILINNAGSLGEMKHVGKLTENGVVSTYHINTIAPILLSNKFVAKYRNVQAKRIVLNISSGAAIHLSDGWSIYSSTKAALDTFTRVAQLEQELDNTGIRFLSVHPGIIETKMQEEIRKNQQEDFSNVEYFRELKSTGQLKTPEHIAKLLLDIVEGNYEPEDVVFSLRNHPQY
ncbi:MAG: SDR family NAD(P)-dependent oxidoreductase [Bacteroidetes bacterium]|nr:MAG: SDR family NAD(P)-dependent oxidoreductase [Bacteroidota bacterium]